MIYTLAPDSPHFNHLLAFRLPSGVVPRQIDMARWEIPDDVTVAYIRCATCGVELVEGTEYDRCGDAEPWSGGDIPWQSNPDSWMGDSAPSPW